MCIVAFQSSICTSPFPTIPGVKDCPYLARTNSGSVLDGLKGLVLPKGHPPVAAIPDPPAPDSLLFFHGGPNSIFTANPANIDETAHCLVTRNEVILKIGFSAAECTALQQVEFPSATAVEIPPGALLTPGLIDPHVHVINGGLSLSRLHLGGVRSKEEFVERVRAAAAAVPESGWLVGGNWDQEDWGGALPEVRPC